MELNFLSVGAFVVACSFIRSLANPVVCFSRATCCMQRRGNVAMPCACHWQCWQGKNIQLVWFTHLKLCAHSPAQSYSLLLCFYTPTLAFSPRTLCPFVWLLAFPFPLFNKQLLASAAITTRVAGVAAAAKNLFASACQKIRCLVLPMLPLLPLKAVGGGDAATSVELYYASAAAAAVAAAVAAADACRKQFFCALSQY